MRNNIGILSAFVLAFSLATAITHAATPPAAPSKGALQNDLLTVLGDSEEKVLSLADAVPRSKYGWRPAPGVRSIGEAYLHIAFGNYAMIKMATGNEPPADAKWDMKATKWDAQTTDKAEIRKILEKSFAQVHQAIAAFADADLDKKVNFFFWTRGDRPLGPSDASRPYRRTPRAGGRLRPEQQGDAALEQGGEIADPCRAAN
jgi:uncharacterized damage-inducible protein DinB